MKQQQLLYSTSFHGEASHLVGGKLACPLTCRTRGYEASEMTEATNTDEAISLTSGPPAGYIYPAAAAGLPSPPPKSLEPVPIQSISTDLQSEAPRIPRPLPAPTVDMAEHGNPPRRRRRDPESEEFAIAVRGAYPERQQRGIPNQWAYWRDGNGNHSGPTAPTRFQRDTVLILRLLRSGKVDVRELCSYRSPVAILDQGRRIDPVNSAILDILNDMAVSRRVVLDFKLKEKPNAAESMENKLKLARWPGEVLLLQGKVEGLGGRYLRIPPLLLTPV